MTEEIESLKLSITIVTVAYGLGLAVLGTCVAILKDRIRKLEDKND